MVVRKQQRWAFWTNNFVAKS